MATKHIAKKSLGQNFLADPNVRQRIVDACALKLTDTVIEIGPGQGAITELMVSRVGQLVAVETDKDLILPLKTKFSDSHIDIIHQDFLKWDMEQYLSTHGNAGEKVKVIGNIPYYISTPIVEYIIERKAIVSKVWMTVQLEFAHRLVAKPNSKDYGSLSCFVQYYTKPEILFKISKGCFQPRPKVDSAFVCLEFKHNLEAKVNDEKKLFRMIQMIFTQRRKTILNALSLITDKAHAEKILNAVKITSQRRPETLELNEFINIFNSI